MNTTIQRVQVGQKSLDKLSEKKLDSNAVHLSRMALVRDYAAGQESALSALIELNKETATKFPITDKQREDLVTLKGHLIKTAVDRLVENPTKLQKIFEITAKYNTMINIAINQDTKLPLTSPSPAELDKKINLRI